MTLRDVFTKRRILLISLAVTIAIVVVGIYVNSPSVLLWVNPQNSITITSITYPSESYRNQNLPVTVHLSNIGDSKDAVVELISKDSSIQSGSLQLVSNSNSNVTLWLPMASVGAQAFTVKVCWVGPGGFCRLDQNSTDRPIKVLAADYTTSSQPRYASRAQEFDWTLTVTNTGNTPADVTVQIIQKDPLIISSSDTKHIENIQVDETRSINFHFIVPSSADLGDHTITVSYTTTYPDIAYYNDCKETTTCNYMVTIQESTIKTQIDNANYLLVAILAIGGGAGAMTFLKRRQ